MTADKAREEEPAADGSEDGPVEEPGPSLLQKMEQFDRWHGAATRARTSSAAADDVEDAAPPAILPDGWRSERSKRPRRGPRPRRIPWRIRISIVLVALVVAAGVAGALIYIPKFAEDTAADLLDDYRTELALLQATIPGATESSAAIADPGIDAIELSIRIVPFGRFRAASLSLSETVRKALPDLPPLFPDQPVQDLSPTRERLSLVAGRADVIASRLNKFVTYRIEFERMFLLPRLPNRVEASEANELSLALAEMLADSLDALTRLPTDPFLDGHRGQVTATFEFFQQWEIDYLDALRRGAPAQAAALASEAVGAVRVLESGLDAPLQALQSWAEEELAGLDRDITGGLILVGR